jgi:membrane protease YdiL (CAAX protease family)
MDEKSRPDGAWPFFVVAWTITTLALLPAILAQHQVITGPSERYLALAPFAVFSPMLAAMLVSRLEPRGEGVRAVFRPLRSVRAPISWYALAFVVSPLLFFLGVAAYKLAGGSGDVAWFYPPRTADRIAAMILVPIGEEIGWRGFALPRMQRRHGPLRASVLMGCGWGLWHVPMFLANGVRFGALLGAMVLFFVPGSIVYSWVFNRTRGLLPVAVVMHIGIHTNNSMLSLPDNDVPFFIHFAVLALAAALILVGRRLRLRNAIERTA